MIEWNTVKYIDCMDPEEGLPSLPDQSIDLCFTDPPYNVGYKGYHKEIDKLYNDDSKEYLIWSKRWFTEIMRICKKLVFTCGTPNIGMWYLIENPVDIFIHYKRNSQGVSRLARFNRFEPMLFYGNFKKGFLFKENVFDIYERNGFLRKKWYKHPSPKNPILWQKLIEIIDPKTVIDPFLGSGTTAAVCKKLGIKWYGYELNPEYQSDIEYCLSSVKYTRKLRQEVLC